MGSCIFARLSPRSRAFLVDLVETHGLSPGEAAARLGVSERTAYRWLRRYRTEGQEGLTDRSSRPRCSPMRLPSATEVVIVSLRRLRRTGPQIALELGLPRSTVGLVLKRSGLGKLSSLEPREPVRRYEHKAAGDMLHLDIKKLGRIVRPGHRVTGNRRDTVDGAGWEYVHVCIDDYSRVAYVEVLANEKADTTTGFLERATAWFASRGIKVRRVLTDNGSAYCSRLFLGRCRELGAKACKTRPYTPRTNGKAERFIQTLLREWAYVRPYANSAERTECLRLWLRYYNLERRHGTLGTAPAARLKVV